MAAPPYAPGAVLGAKYRVERVLGEGGMGVVLAVRHILLDERRALKVMLPEVLGSAEARERFLREARAAARLKSEHVTKVHDVGALPGGEPYIELEFLEGRDLQQLLKERGPLTVVDVLGWVAQACEAIAEAHAQGIVHRDLKPANLFLTTRPNGTPCVKVLDFGIAKVAGPDENLSLTRTSSTFGSPLYMSPEQMQSTRLVGPATDVWAMGVILYELLTGKVPFDAETVTGLAITVASREPPRPSRLRTDVPAQVEAVILRCLAKDPTARFANAGALGQALEAILSELGSSTFVMAPPAALLEPAASSAAPTPRMAMQSHPTGPTSLSVGVAPAASAPLPRPSAPSHPQLGGPTLLSHHQPASSTGSAGGVTSAPLSRTVGPKRGSQIGWVVAGAGAGLLVVAVAIAAIVGKKPVAQRDRHDQRAAASNTGAPATEPSVEVSPAESAAPPPPEPTATATPAATTSASAAATASATAAPPPPPKYVRPRPKRPGGFQGVD